MLVVGFALLQWSQRELLSNIDGTPHFSDDVYMSATTLFALGLGDVAPEGFRAGRNEGRIVPAPDRQQRRPVGAHVFLEA